MNCKNCDMPILSGQTYMVIDKSHVMHAGECPRILSKTEIFRWHKLEIMKLKQRIAGLERSVSNEWHPIKQIV